MVVKLPLDRVLAARPFRLRTWTGLLPVYKPAMTRPRVTASRVEKTILFHETELPSPPSLLKIDYAKGTDRFHEGVLVLGFGLGIEALSQISKAKRRYKIQGCFGRSTDTFTVDGSTIDERPIGDINMEMVESILEEKFQGSIILPLPPVKLLDERPVLDRKQKRRSEKEQALPALTSHFDLVYKPHNILSIKCTELDLPYFTVEVSSRGDLNPYGLIYSIAHELGTCGHVSRSRVEELGNFSLQECVSEEMVDDPRHVYNTLCNCWSLWNTSVVSRKHRRSLLEKEKAKEERNRLHSMAGLDERKRVALRELMPLMAKGAAVSREDCPAAATAIREKLIGRSGLSDLEDVLDEMGGAIETPVEKIPDLSSPYDGQRGKSREDLARTPKEADFVDTPEAPNLSRPQKRAELDPHEFATVRRRSNKGYVMADMHGTGDASAPTTSATGTGQHFNLHPNVVTRRGQSTSLDTKKRVRDVTDAYGSVRDRLKDIHRRQQMRNSGFTWRSKYGV